MYRTGSVAWCQVQQGHWSLRTWAAMGQSQQKNQGNSSCWNIGYTNNKLYLFHNFAMFRLHPPYSHTDPCIHTFSLSVSLSYSFSLSHDFPLSLSLPLPTPLSKLIAVLVRRLSLENNELIAKGKAFFIASLFNNVTHCRTPGIIWARQKV